MHWKAGLVLGVYGLNMGAGVAQNLVPNGSFEQYDTCPQFTGYGEYATGWFDLHTNSADYFNSCNGGTVVGVPFNQFGYQQAADGEAYMGMAASSPGGGPWYRELVGIELSQPLIPGVPICLSFKTAMGGFGSWSGNSTPYSCKGIGLKFFTQFPDDWSLYLYPNSAALSLDVVPTDTAIWYSVSGMYVPDSAYAFIAVGNFFENALVDLTLIDSTGYGTFPLAYAFVDDVRASFDLAYCTTANGAEERRSRGWSMYPNPATTRVQVRGLNEAGTLWRVFDLTGRIVESGRSTGQGLEIWVGDWAPGEYILQVGEEHRRFARFVVSP